MKQENTKARVSYRRDRTLFTNKLMICSLVGLCLLCGCTSSQPQSADSSNTLIPAFHDPQIKETPLMQKQELSEWLKSTRQLNYHSPEVVQFRNSLLQKAGLNQATASAKELAMCFHDGVRDGIPFGFNGGFYTLTAAEIVNNKRGFCQNKAVVLVALLRSVGIPARMVFVSLKTEVLKPLVETYTEYVDHCVTEVYLDQRWIKFDSYVVDQPLFARAKQQLKESKKLLGWGLHKDAQFQWSGDSEAFSQFVWSDAKNIAPAEFGEIQGQALTCHDPDDYYRKAQRPNHKFGWFQRLIFRLIYWLPNQQIQSFRSRQLLVKRN